MNFKKWLTLTEKIMIKDQEFREPLLALQYIQKTNPNSENLAVTFTAIDKVGINPTSGYETPIGIYFYPLDYVVKRKMNVPFAGDQPHINVCEFTRPEKILHMTSDVYNQKGMELLNVFPKEQVDQAIKNAGEYEIRSNYSKFWAVTKILANNKPTQWNVNFRKCGIDGFVDHGTGTIHSNESTQCVVFSANDFKLLHSIDNPMFDKTTDKYGVDKYNIKKDKYDSNKMEEEQIIRMLQSRRNLDITNLLKTATDKDKVVDLTIKYKIQLLNDDITLLMFYAKDKDKTAELIINKKSNTSFAVVKDLLKYSIDKNKIAQIINKYHTNKTPEIQKEIDKYLEPQAIAAR